jgi:hypothetical protein
MKSRAVASVLVVVLSISAHAAEKWNRILVDISKGTVSPADPVVNTASGTDVAISIVDGENAVGVDAVLFRFPRTVYQRTSSGLTPVEAPEGFTVAGTALSLNFKKCNELKGIVPDPDAICPAIVVQNTKTPVAAVYSDNDGIEVFAEHSATKTFAAGATTRIPILIGVVKRRAGLSFSAGLSFFGESSERWGVQPIDGNDTEVRLIQLDDESAPYKLAANANYMGLFGPPALGLSFGVATDVPFESLATTLGFTYTIRTLPIADSANLTVGMAYAPHKVLLADYRGRTTVPAGIAVDGLTADQHDVGWFVGFSFNFAGGEEQFKTVFSGSGKKSEDVANE